MALFFFNDGDSRSIEADCFNFDIACPQGSANPPPNLRFAQA